MSKRSLLSIEIYVISFIEAKVIRAAIILHLSNVELLIGMVV